MTPWDELVKLSLLTCPEGGWKPGAIAAQIDAALQGSNLADRELLGHSFEGRPITLLKLGNGPRRVLMWSQMHGDEPTHTTALLNLLGLLARGDAAAEQLLTGLTLGIITPLNPDGAERCTRQNAQGIDVNRDALAFATHEGRALRDALQSFQPQYGLNLHNQPYRRGVGSPLEPAAVTLLVPPVDEQDTQTDSTREATRVAAFFAEAASPHCGGRLTRYQIDYMARAFGEWVQRQGVAALLIEASGWPGGDFLEPERLHFAALVQTLEAIAESGLGDDSALAGADPQSYLGLPKSITKGLHDLLINVSGVAQKASGELSTAAIAIDYPSRSAAKRDRLDGIIADLGDLRESGGLDLIEARESLALPGRIAWAGIDSTYQTMDWEQFLANGVTTALVPVDLAQEDLAKQLQEITEAQPPINASLIGYYGQEKPTDYEARLRLAIGSGLAAIVLEQPDDELKRLCESLILPTLTMSAVPLVDRLPSSAGAWVEQVQTISDLLGWSDLGRIALGGPANLVLATATEPIAASSVQTVLLNGTIVYGTGEPKNEVGGRWIV